MIETVEKLDDPKQAQAFVWNTRQKSSDYSKERWNLLSKHRVVIQSNNKTDAGRTFLVLAKEKRRKKDILKFQVGLKMDYEKDIKVYKVTYTLSLSFASVLLHASKISLLKKPVLLNEIAQ